MNLDPNSRVQIVETPYMKPACCVLCKNPGNDGRMFVDVNVSLPRYGRFYFCMTCFEEINHTLGWMGPANYEYLLEANQTMQDDIEQLKEENAKLTAALGDHARKLVADLSSLLPKPEVPKRSPGRPAKAKSEPVE